MTATGFVGRADGTRVIEDLTPETLRELLLDAAERVVVEPSPGGPPGHAQATRVGREAWRLEVHGEREQLAAQASNTDAAFDVLRSWAAGDDWWREAFSWDRIDRRGQPPVR